MQLCSVLSPHPVSLKATGRTKVKPYFRSDSHAAATALLLLLLLLQGLKPISSPTPLQSKRVPTCNNRN